MIHKTTITKGFHGLTAETDIMLRYELDAGGRQLVLQVRTAKRDGGKVQTTAYAYHMKFERGFMSAEHMFGFGAQGGDFEYRFPTVPVARVTAKALEVAHIGALAGIEAVVEKAKAHYGLVEAPAMEAA